MTPHVAGVRAQPRSCHPEGTGLSCLNARFKLGSKADFPGVFLEMILRCATKRGLKEKGMGICKGAEGRGY